MEEVVEEESMPHNSCDLNKCNTGGGLTLKKQQIREITNDEKLTLEEKALRTMNILKCWDDIWGLADTINCGMKDCLPSCLAKKWSPRSLLELDIRYNNFDLIPLTVGERTILQASPNGNCIFNSISIALSGNEDLSMLLRLMSVVKIADRLVELSKYLREEYGELAAVWCEASQQPTVENIETSLRHSLLDIVSHPYKDGTFILSLSKSAILNLIMASHLLERPIYQHCVSSRHTENQQVIFPPLDPIRYPAAIHLVWVPTNPKSRLATINHVVPAVCMPGKFDADADECAFTGLGLCGLQHGFNSHVCKPHWICCGICDQWVHTFCMGIKQDSFQNRQFACGCDALTENGEPNIKDLAFYQNLSIGSISKFLELQEVVRETPQSLRMAVFSNPGNRQLKEDLKRRSGPFTDQLINCLKTELNKLVTDDEEILVPYIYVPEVLLKIIMFQEEVTRLVAEKILLVSTMQ